MSRLSRALIAGTIPKGAKSYLREIESLYRQQKELLEEDSEKPASRRLGPLAWISAALIAVAGCSAPEGYIQAKKGDTISSYAAQEGITDARGIGRYVQGFLGDNEYHRHLDDGNTLVVGDWYLARDSNQDGLVGGRPLMTWDQKEAEKARQAEPETIDHNTYQALKELDIPSKEGVITKEEYRTLDSTTQAWLKSHGIEPDVKYKPAPAEPEPTPAEQEYQKGAGIYRMTIKDSDQRLEGISYFNSAHELALEEGNLELAADALFSAAYLRFEQDSRVGNFDKAIAAYQRAENFIGQNQVRLNLLDEIASMYAQMD